MFPDSRRTSFRNGSCHWFRKNISFRESATDFRPAKLPKDLPPAFSKLPGPPLILRQKCCHCYFRRAESGHSCRSRRKSAWRGFVVRRVEVSACSIPDRERAQKKQERKKESEQETFCSSRGFQTSFRDEATRFPYSFSPTI